MALDFAYTEEESVRNGVKLMVHAPAGTGKTMLCATLPTPVIFSAESGLLSLTPKNIARVYGADRDDINYNMLTIKIRNVADLEDAHQWATESHEASEYETFALDSISEIMEQILTAAKVSNRDGRAAYGDLHEQGIVLVKGFRDIEGKNIYMSAKQGPFKDEATNITKYGPMMPGSKLGPSIPYLFDEVYALRLGQDDAGMYRFLQTQPDLQYEAKCRSGSLELHEEAHLGRLIAKIKQDENY